MSIKERFFGAKENIQDKAEKVTKLAKAVDAATIIGAFALGAVYPPLVGAANAAIAFSVGTYALTEAAESEIKKRKKN